MRINVPHTQVGWQFCFFFYTRLLCLFSPHVWFLLRCFLSAFIAGLFRCVEIVVALSISDFNWFHLRFFPPLVMSLWIWFSLESYAFVKFYLLLSQADNNELWFMILIWTFFIIPTDSDSSFSWWFWRHLPFSSHFCSAPRFFRTFPRRLAPFFLAYVFTLRLSISLPTLDACTVSTA